MDFTLVVLFFTLARNNGDRQYFGNGTPTQRLTLCKTNPKYVLNSTLSIVAPKQPKSGHFFQKIQK